MVISGTMRVTITIFVNTLELERIINYVLYNPGQSRLG